MNVFKYLVLSLRRSRYKDLTVYSPKLVRLHTNLSFLVVRWTLINYWTNYNQIRHLWFKKVLLKEIFSGLRDSTFAIETCLEYIEGYLSAKDLFPSHVSSQSHVPSPLPTVNDPLVKKSSFAFIKPFQKGETSGLTETSIKEFECKYLFYKNSCHTLLHLVT
jgi:hypothetical protein